MAYAFHKKNILTCKCTVAPDSESDNDYKKKDVCLTKSQKSKIFKRLCLSNTGNTSSTLS